MGRQKIILLFHSQNVKFKVMLFKDTLVLYHNVFFRIYKTMQGSNRLSEQAMVDDHRLQLPGLALWQEGDGGPGMLYPHHQWVSGQ